MDRATACGAVGCAFESHRGYFYLNGGITSGVARYICVPHSPVCPRIDVKIEHTKLNIEKVGVLDLDIRRPVIKCTLTPPAGIMDPANA